MRHSGVVELEGKEILQALEFPVGTKLIAARVRHIGDSSWLLLEVDHHSLPEVEAGEASPDTFLIRSRIEARFDVHKPKLVGNKVSGDVYHHKGTDP